MKYLAVVLMAYCLYHVGLERLPISGFSNTLSDQAEYVSMARNISEKNLYRPNLFLLGTIDRDSHHIHMPGYSIVLSLFYSLFGYGVFVSYLPSLLGFLLSLLVLTKQMGQNSAWTFLSPMLWAYSVTAMPEVLVVSIGCVAIFLYWKFGNSLPWLLAPLLFGVCYLFRETALILLPSFFLIDIFLKRFKFPTAILSVTLVAFVFFVINQMIDREVMTLLSLVSLMDLGYKAKYYTVYSLLSLDFSPLTLILHLCLGFWKRLTELTTTSLDALVVMDIYHLLISQWLIIIAAKEIRGIETHRKTAWFLLGSFQVFLLLTFTVSTLGMLEITRRSLLAMTVLVMLIPKALPNDRLLRATQLAGFAILIFFIAPMLYGNPDFEDQKIALIKRHQPQPDQLLSAPYNFSMSALLELYPLEFTGFPIDAPSLKLLHQNKNVGTIIMPFDFIGTQVTEEDFKALGYNTKKMDKLLEMEVIVFSK